jgi:hypothetical protein
MILRPGARWMVREWYLSAVIQKDSVKREERNRPDGLGPRREP